MTACSAFMCVCERERMKEAMNCSLNLGHQKKLTKCNLQLRANASLHMGHAQHRRAFDLLCRSVVVGTARRPHKTYS